MFSQIIFWSLFFLLFWVFLILGGYLLQAVPRFFTKWKSQA